jgi:SAM-dependent methyltransferase
MGERDQCSRPACPPHVQTGRIEKARAGSAVGETGRVSQNLETVHSSEPAGAEGEPAGVGGKPVGVGGKPERFDAQARVFDRRAGLPADAARAVARAVLDLAAPGPDDLLVELGAGTGQIGQHLAGSVRYMGIDWSSSMLEVFGEKLATADDARVRLSHSDADRPWPLSDGSVAIVFASRVAHLLNAEHLVAELLRVCRPRSCFLVGRVTRDPDGVKSRMRRQRGLLLRKHGLARQDIEKTTEGACGRLLASGATRVEARPVATWTAAASVRDILAAWEMVGAIGGRQLDAATRASVLAELERWAAHELGDPNTVTTWEEQYILEGVRMAGGRQSTSCVP